MTIDWSLYVIIDYEWLQKRNLSRLVNAIIKGGATVIQYRDKISDSGEFYQRAKRIREITASHHIPFIVNDRLDIGLAVEADGVHLGQNDLPLFQARQIVGQKMILGISVSKLSEFNRSSYADYYGVGSIYSTDTKQNIHISGIDLIRQIRTITSKPIIGIGGIHSKNLLPVLEVGGDGIAVISSVLGAKNVCLATKRLYQSINRYRIKTR